MFAQFVNVLYSIVDRIYIGNIPGIGGDSLAGAGVCAPINVVAIPRNGNPCAVIK